MASSILCTGPRENWAFKKGKIKPILKETFANWESAVMIVLVSNAYSNLIYENQENYVIKPWTFDFNHQFTHFESLLLRFKKCKEPLLWKLVDDFELRFYIFK